MSCRKPILLLAVLSSLWLAAHSQCNTTLNKLLPAKAISNNDRFGSAISANNQFLVIAAENSDTLGILFAGAVYVYEQTPSGWAYRAMLTASDPDEYAFFGVNVDIDASGNTIIVADRTIPKSKIYIFEKPSAGWQSATESVKITTPDVSAPPVPARISDDGETIAIGQSSIKVPSVYVYKKPGDGWSPSLVPQVISGPQAFFGIDVQLHNEYLYIGSDNDSNGNGIYVYKDNGGQYDFLAKLSTTLPGGAAGYYGRNLTTTGDLVATTASVFIQNGDSGLKIFIYRKTGEWTNAVELTRFELPGTDETLITPSIPIQFISPTELACSVLLRDGSSFRGKVIVVKATDASWQNFTTETIFEQGGLHQQSGFSWTMHWNGTDLLRSMGTVTTSYGVRDAVVSMTRSGGLWGSIHAVSLNRFNSAEFQFGQKVHKTGKLLFAGSPYDRTAGRAAGAVYLYQQNGQTFTRLSTTAPTRRDVRSNGTYDFGFGYSIASSEEDVAISAPGFRYGTGVLGRIYMYRRTGTDGSKLELYDSLSPPTSLVLNHVGTEIAMNDRFLFASSYNNFNNEHTNGLIIFEKVNGTWLFRDLLKIAKPIDKEWPSLRMSLYENQLLVGAPLSIDGGVFLVTQSAETDKWEVEVEFSGEVFSGLGSDVVLQENHLFAGAANFNYQNVHSSGVVLVYSRLPGQQWNSQMTPSIIAPNDLIEGGRFGASLDAIGNTLAVGAPGSIFEFSGDVRTVPGNTYIIQSKNYEWTETTQFLRLQGERYAQSEQDFFGFDVGIDLEMFYIGANNENTEAGRFSGAAYYIPTPPVIFLEPPVCKTTGILQLEAYPFGGTWAGNGIIDPSGKFDTQLAGIGTHVLTYTTSACALTGTVHLEVKPGPILSLNSPQETILCDQGKVPLSIVADGGASYVWFFRPPGAANFVEIVGGTNGSIEVAFPGEYYASASNQLCSTDSPVFTVLIESVTLEISPRPVVCEHQKSISLDIPIIEETWAGTNVTNNVFNSGTLANGIYNFTYNFNTSAGCNITLRDSIRINIPSPVSVQRIPNNYCETGSAVLKAVTPDVSITHKWDYAPDASLTFAEIQKPLGAIAEVFEAGYYRVRVSNGDCAAASLPTEVGLNSDMIFTMTPAEGSETEVCKEKSFPINIEAPEGTAFTWMFAETDQFTPIGDGGAEHHANSSGYYRVAGSYGFCSFLSEPVKVQFRRDSVSVPNVFTPNGDAHNNTFSISSNIEDYALLVLDRNGVVVHSANSGSWDGADVPAGVYYWQVSYAECDGARRAINGWVHLIR